MSVYQKWVCNVLANYTCLVHINVINVINQINAFALTRVSRFYDPNVFLGLMLFQFLVMVIKVAKLVWKYVGVRDEVESCFTEFLLHANEIKAKTVLTGDLMTLREVVDLLVLVQALVLIGFACARAP